MFPQPDAAGAGAFALSVEADDDFGVDVVEGFVLPGAGVDPPNLKALGVDILDDAAAPPGMNEKGAPEEGVAVEEEPT